MVRKYRATPEPSPEGRIVLRGLGDVKGKGSQS